MTLSSYDLSGGPAGISVIIPIKGPLSLSETLHSIAASSQEPREVVVVHSTDVDQSAILQSAKYPFDLRYIRQTSGVLEAKAIGARAAESSHVLFIDSDQTVGAELISELMRAKAAVAMIPETCNGSSLLSRLVDRQKRFVHEASKLGSALDYPVSPRFYDRRVVLAGLRRIEESCPLGMLRSHEDSALFIAAFESCGLTPKHDIYWANGCIDNMDIEFKSHVRKAYIYGVSHGALRKFARMNRNARALEGGLARLNAGHRWSAAGLGVDFAGLLHDAIQGPPYYIGYLVGKFRMGPGYG